MTATVCSNPIKWDLSRGACQFLVEATWDGTSTPTSGCDGVVSRVFFDNKESRVFYGHLPATRLGPAVYQILPGATTPAGGITNRALLHAAGLDSRSDIVGAEGIVLNEVPPQAGETLLNP